MLFQKNSPIKVYTDGSCNFRIRKLGIGVVIGVPDTKEHVIYSATIHPAQNLDLYVYGPLKAEFAAATHALNELPEKSSIELHTDHPILRKVLNRYLDGLYPLWEPRTKKGHTPEFISLLDTLLEAANRHEFLTVIRANDINCEQMLWAHKAAAQGSGASGRSKIRRVHPPVITGIESPSP